MLITFNVEITSRLYEVNLAELAETINVLIIYSADLFTLCAMHNLLVSFALNLKYNDATVASLGTRVKPT